MQDSWKVVLKQWMPILFLACGLSSLFAQTSPARLWIGTWAAAPYAHSGPQVPNLSDSTLRQIVHTTTPGLELRLRVSNEFGLESLTIDAAHVALSAGRDAIQPGTDHAATFGGRNSITIPPGSVAVSDPVALQTSASRDLAISLHLPPQQISIATFHGFAGQTNYIANGDHVSAATLTGGAEIKSWYFLKGVDVVVNSPDAGAIVAFGDSITDGVGSTIDLNQRWPDLLFQRLHANLATSNLAVINEGMGGNRILRDGTGPSALTRFDRDVLSQSGVKYVVVLEGINDIGRLAWKNDPIDSVTAEDVELGLEQLAARAHDHNLKIFAATITPYKGAGYFTEAGESVRKAVNDWIRTSKVFDGVVDFDSATQSSQDQLSIKEAYDSHDHLHPNDQGYKAMSDAFDLQLFH